MHIKKSLPSTSYTKVDNAIWANPTLSDGAKVLYGFLASLPNGKTIYDGYLVKCLGIAPRTLTNRKKELKDAGLILMDRLAPNVYDLYVGSLQLNANQVKNIWAVDNLVERKSNVSSIG